MCDAPFIGQCATLACILEATAPKPGNVYRGADFEDVTYLDFLTSAAVIGPIMQRAPGQGIGTTVWQAIRATREYVGTNTNLGTVLLLAPLCAVPIDRPIVEGVRQVLGSLTAEDARLVYESIRLAQPGGLGQVADMDIAAEAPADLRDAMAAAAERDLVARQYTNSFAEVLQEIVPWLTDRPRGVSWLDQIVYTHVRLMSRWPDSLIARKCGRAIADESAIRASQVIDTGPPGGDAYHEQLADLDFWLRSDGHRRNPGTSADLIAAALFVGLRERSIQPPW